MDKNATRARARTFELLLENKPPKALALAGAVDRHAITSSAPDSLARVAIGLLSRDEGMRNETRMKKSAPKPTANSGEDFGRAAVDAFTKQWRMSQRCSCFKRGTQKSRHSCKPYLTAKQQLISLPQLRWRTALIPLTPLLVAFAITSTAVRNRTRPTEVGNPAAAQQAPSEQDGRLIYTAVGGEIVRGACRAAPIGGNRSQSTPSRRPIYQGSCSPRGLALSIAAPNRTHDARPMRAGNRTRRLAAGGRL